MRPRGASTIVSNRATNTIYTAEEPAVTYELDPEDKENHLEWEDDENAA